MQNEQLKQTDEAEISSDIQEIIETGKVLARALADACPSEDRLALARSFCRRVVEAWWAELTNSNPISPLREFLKPAPKIIQLPEPGPASAEIIGRAAAKFDLENAAYSIGLIYTSMLPQSFRAEHGIYYTPPRLVSRLIDQASVAGADWATCRVLDPACGGGAFLAPVALKIISTLPDVEPAILVKNIASRLRGYEVDPFAAWLSQVTLDAAVLPITTRANARLPVVVSICDSLKRNPPRDRFDLVIGNPPYGRLKLSSEDRDRFKRSLFGHANLYGLFTDLALRHVRTGGIIAYVTPTSFLAGEYFKNLRTLLARHAPPATIDFVSARKGVFDGVLQETLLATYRRKKPAQPAQTFEAHPTDDSDLQVTATGSFSVPPVPSHPWIMARSPDQAPLVKRLQEMPFRLSDWGYSVSTEPLVWNRFKDQLKSRNGRDRLPLIWAESVTSDGRFSFRAEKKNHEPFFEI